MENDCVKYILYRVTDAKFSVQKVFSLSKETETVINVVCQDHYKELYDFVEDHIGNNLHHPQELYQAVNQILKKTCVNIGDTSGNEYIVKKERGR